MKKDGKRIYSRCERYFINFTSYNDLTNITIYNSLGSAVGSYNLKKVRDNIYAQGSVAFVLPRLKYKRTLPDWF